MKVQLKTMKQVGIISSDALISRKNKAAGGCQEDVYNPWNLSSAQDSTLFQTDESKLSGYRQNVGKEVWW